MQGLLHFCCMEQVSVCKGISIRTNAQLSVWLLHDEHGNVASQEFAMLIELADDSAKAAGAIKGQHAQLWPVMQKVPAQSKAHAQKAC